MAMVTRHAEGDAARARRRRNLPTHAHVLLRAFRHAVSAPSGVWSSAKELGSCAHIACGIQRDSADSVVPKAAAGYTLAPIPFREEGPDGRGVGLEALVFLARGGGCEPLLCRLQQEQGHQSALE